MANQQFPRTAVCHPICIQIPPQGASALPPVAPCVSPSNRSTSADQCLPPVSTGGEEPTSTQSSFLSLSRLQPGSQRTRPPRAHRASIQNGARPAKTHQRCNQCTRPISTQPAAHRPRCVTFPAHFSKTYNRTSPKLSVRIRAYTGRVSPRPFSRKTAEKSKHPNSRPPQLLAQSPRGLCHHMSPCKSSLQRPIQSPDRQACPWNEVKGGGVISRMHQHNPAYAHHFDVSTFRFFDVSTSHPNPRPPQRLQASPKTFFAYCHLQIYAPPRQPSAQTKRVHMPTNASPRSSPEWGAGL